MPRALGGVDPDNPIQGRAVLLDRLMETLSKLDQYGALRSEPVSSKLREQIVALVDRLLKGQPVRLRAVERKIAYFQKECDRLMGQPEQLNEIRNERSFLRAREELNHLEAKWRNLNQTVPPHAQEWWDRTFAAEKARLLDVRKRLDELSEEEWGSHCETIMGELNSLEDLSRQAEAELGEHTAAGRAKSS